MMKVGARAHDYGRQAPETLFAAIAADGFDTVMLAVQKAITGINSYFDVTPEHITAIDHARCASGLSMEVLGVYMELSLLDDTARQAQVQQFLKGLAAAKALGTAYVASETTAFHKQPEASPQDAYRALQASLETILPQAERLGITVALEPVFYHTLCSPEKAKQLKREMGSQHLKFVFDAVNLFEPQHSDNQASLWDRVFDCIGEDIAVVHMKGVKIEDNQLKSCEFAQSVIDYADVFARLRALHKPLPIIREEVKPINGAADAAFLRSFC